MKTYFLPIIFSAFMIVCSCQSIICNSIKECESNVTPVFVTSDMILEHYGNDDYKFGISAAEICEDMGYKGCLLAWHEEHVVRYETTDGTCEGMQYMVGHLKSLRCKDYGKSTACATLSFPQYVEPLRGDMAYSNHILEVICLE